VGNNISKHILYIIKDQDNSRSIGLVSLGGSQDFAQLHVIAARHFRHGRGQLSGGYATVLPGQLLAAAALLPVAALALHLYQLLARRLRTGSLVASGRTLVTTVCSRLSAALATDLAGRLTGAFVAWLDALVATTGQRLATGKATAEVGL